MSDGPHRAYLSLGSNIDPAANLPAAARLLAEFGRIVAVSQVWETSPIGDADQPNYLNAALLLETDRTARQICDEIIPTVESQLQRVRDPANKNAPRTIDVDLSLYEEDVLQLGRHALPDPAILLHAHVAVPLAELEPMYVHPIDGRRLEEIAAALSHGIAMHARQDVSWAP